MKIFKKDLDRKILRHYWLDGGWGQGGFFKRMPPKYFSLVLPIWRLIMKRYKEISAVNFFLIIEELVSLRVIKDVVPPHAHG